MRLKNVERGDRLSSKALYAVIRLVSGFRAPDVVRTLRYRQSASVNCLRLSSRA
jgi:hypothetical protein